MRPAARFLGATIAGCILAGGLPGECRGAAAWPGPSVAGGSGLLDVRSAETFDGILAVQASALHYRLPVGSVPGETHELDLTDGSVQLLTGFADRFELWFLARVARRDTDVEAASALFGDGRAGAKVRAPVAPGGLQSALALEMSLPWGDRVGGASTDAFDPAITALLTWPLPLPGDEVRARLHVNAGYRFYGDTSGRTFEGTPSFYLEPVYPRGQNDRIDLRAAFEVRAPGTALFAELVLDKLRNDGVAWSEGPRFFNAGFRMGAPFGTAVLAGAKVSLATDDESTTGFREADELYPDWQLTLVLAWAAGQGE